VCSAAAASLSQLVASACCRFCAVPPCAVVASVQSLIGCAVLSLVSRCAPAAPSSLLGATTVAASPASLAAAAPPAAASSLLLLWSAWPPSVPSLAAFCCGSLSWLSAFVRSACFRSASAAHACCRQGHREARCGWHLVLQGVQEGCCRRRLLRQVRSLTAHTGLHAMLADRGTERQSETKHARTIQQSWTVAGWKHCHCSSVPWEQFAAAGLSPWNGLPSAGLDGSAAELLPSAPLPSSVDFGLRRVCAFYVSLLLCSARRRLPRSARPSAVCAR
jgi:hypothetical protein